MNRQHVESALVEASADSLGIFEDEVQITEEPPSDESDRAEPQLMAAADDQHSLDPVPIEVPHRRWLILVDPKRYHPSYMHMPKVGACKVKTATDQTASIDLQLYAEMYVHAELDRKILRLTTLGNGFNMGECRKNGWSHRGAFQDRCELTFGPVGEHPLRMGDTAPSNQNGVATYSSTTSFQVQGKVSAKGGADSKGPSGEAGGEVGGSYSVSNTVSAQLTDFRVENYSDDAAAKFVWSLQQMGDGIAKYTYPYDGPRSLYSIWGYILPLPALARGRLFPACQAWWHAPRDFDGEVTFDIAAVQHASDVVVSHVYTLVAGVVYYPRSIAPPAKTALSSTVTVSFDESLWDVSP